MATKTLHGRCPNCCPDGGACFDRVFGDDGWAKKCTNCFHIYPIRKAKKQTAPNATQGRVIARLVELGWNVTKQEMIGRKVWVAAEHPTKNWLLGNTLFGTIGPAGAFKLTLQTVGKNPVITDDIGVNVYLK